MLEKDFLKICETALIELSEVLESEDINSKLDVEYSDGILEIIINSTKQTYIINRNSGNQKIWYSSPFTGADYFSFNEKMEMWISAKGEELKEKLFSELQKIIK